MVSRESNLDIHNVKILGAKSQARPVIITFRSFPRVVAGFGSDIELFPGFPIYQRCMDTMLGFKNAVGLLFIFFILAANITNLPTH